jgi:hypothetical protein
MKFSEALQLSLTQKFQLHRYTADSQNLPLGEAREMVIELTRQLMIKDNVIRHLLHQQNELTLSTLKACNDD